MSSVESMKENCSSCGSELEIGQIRMCDSCQENGKSKDLEVFIALVSNGDEYIDVDVFVKCPDGSEFMQRMYVAIDKPEALIRDEIRFSPSQDEEFDAGGNKDCPPDVLAKFDASVKAVEIKIKEALGRPSDQNKTKEKA